MKIPYRPIILGLLVLGFSALVLGRAQAGGGHYFAPVTNTVVKEECGSCHLPFYPSLLPARSWVRMMDGQDQHFGTDLGLDAPTNAAILAFLTANAAERHLTEAGLKIDRSLSPSVAPLRITETPYWIKKHRDIRDVTWLAPEIKSKTRCEACHLDALEGTFEDAAMHLPKT